MIQLQVIGHIGKDAVVRTIEGGSTVINFNVAHTTKYKDRAGQLKEETIWVSCSWWIKNTAIAAYLKKGQQVYCEGKPEVDFYNRSNSVDGLVAQQKLVVYRLELIGKKPASDQQGQQPRGAQEPFNASDITEPIDDLPF